MTVDLSDPPFFMVWPVAETYETRHEAVGRAAVLDRTTAGPAFSVEPIDTERKAEALEFALMLDEKLQDKIT